MIFKSQQNKFKSYSKIYLSCKQVYHPESVKYLGVKSDTNLSWQFHAHNFSITLNRAKALLFKIRKYVSLKLLRSIYFAIFDSYLPYCCLVWPRDCTTIQQIVISKKKNYQFSTKKLPYQSPIETKLHIKIQDKICLGNILFVNKSLNNLSPSVFNRWFSFFVISI